MRLSSWDLWVSGSLTSIEVLISSTEFVLFSTELSTRISELETGSTAGICDFKLGAS
ncbi:hypothetical protein OX283_011145 [Flavobacterium sp. SUN052]|uniref:hypothetical protein n=1 Tax=Flavobacterium sp. SUN052 TaxID=3002441 RepID=UPI00237E4488|nr:hypothetical protein [Flavobacterium sp. SUN052]MEC4005214.1 hypothetical protein [Flavobacterium sp. SUN052]